MVDWPGVTVLGVVGLFGLAPGVVGIVDWPGVTVLGATGFAELPPGETGMVEGCPLWMTSAEAVAAKETNSSAKESEEASFMFQLRPGMELC
jgi:hypothetical protein